MRYQGSKFRHAKQIIQAVEDNSDAKRDWFLIEPFVGGGNFTMHWEGPSIGYDKCKYAVGCLDLIKQLDFYEEYIPQNRDDEYTEKAYKFWKNIDPEDEKLISIKGYWGYALSFGGRFFEGFRRSDKRDYAKESYNFAKKQSTKIQNARFFQSDYLDLEYWQFDNIEGNKVFYLDPPYKSTKKYKSAESEGKGFDHDEFWEWVRELSRNNLVFVSEYQAPDFMEEIWAKPVSTCVNRKASKKAVEKLFRVKKCIF